MNIIGRLIKVLPVETGEGRNGTWHKGAFVIETEEQYPKKVYFTMWGEDRINSLNDLRAGEQIRVHFSPESREYNERWYTDLRCFRIDKFNTVVQAGPSDSTEMPAKPKKQASVPEDGDLPF